jgi:hypothetical protein
MSRWFQFSLLRGLRDPPASAWSARLTIFSLALCAVASAATIAMLFYAGNPQEPGWYLPASAFACWAVSPYLGLAALALLGKKNTEFAAVIACASTFLGTFAAWAIGDAYFVHIDAQGALVFIFAPLYQWAGVAMIATVLGITATINWLRSRPQFSLRSLLMVMCCVALICGLLRLSLLALE